MWKAMMVVLGLAFRSCCHVKDVSKSIELLMEAEKDDGLLERTMGKLNDFLAERTITQI